MRGVLPTSLSMLGEQKGETRRKVCVNICRHPHLCHHAHTHGIASLLSEYKCENMNDVSQGRQDRKGRQRRKKEGRKWRKKGGRGERERERKKKKKWKKGRRVVSTGKTRRQFASILTLSNFTIIFTKSCTVVVKRSNATSSFSSFSLLTKSRLSAVSMAFRAHLACIPSSFRINLCTPSSNTASLSRSNTTSLVELR
mmetsp:Transcript_6558/g.16286  ORF Transcript_6558/g.16286 Transcript_6558/m.16286 type:complete len:198 (-) Transcript_6558:2133-2726(-)